MRKDILILLGVFILLLLTWYLFQKRDRKVVETIAIVTRPKQSGDIIIFFEQDTAVGRYQKQDGKFLFYMEGNPSIFFIKEKLGSGYLENYQIVNGKITEINYASEISINDANDTSYQVIGGSYRGISIHEYKNGNSILRFISFKAGAAKNIKKTITLPEQTVAYFYKRVLDAK